MMSQHAMNGPDDKRLAGGKWEYLVDGKVFSPADDHQDWSELEEFPDWDSEWWDSRPATKEDIAWAEMPNLYRCYLCGYEEFSFSQPQICENCRDNTAASTMDEVEAGWTENHVEKAKEMVMKSR